MTQDNKPSESARRTARLRSALRDNLRRRKAQAKARASAADRPEGVAADTAPNSAGFAGDKSGG